MVLIGYMKSKIMKLSKLFSRTIWIVFTNNCCLGKKGVSDGGKGAMHRGSHL